MSYLRALACLGAGFAIGYVTGANAVLVVEEHESRYQDVGWADAGDEY